MGRPGSDRRLTIDRRRLVSGAAAESESTAAPAEDLWDAHDVARHLKVSVSWVRQRVSANQIPFVRIGGWMVRFRPHEIRAFSTSRNGSTVLPANERGRG